MNHIHNIHRKIKLPYKALQRLHEVGKGNQIKRAEMALITLKWEIDAGITGYAVMHLLSYQW